LRRGGGGGGRRRWWWWWWGECRSRWGWCLRRGRAGWWGWARSRRAATLRSRGSSRSLSLSPLPRSRRAATLISRPFIERRILSFPLLFQIPIAFLSLPILAPFALSLSSATPPHPLPPHSLRVLLPPVDPSSLPPRSSLALTRSSPPSSPISLWSLPFSLVSSALACPH
jgi:hypothetical protein